jgi:hypothetical protein
MPLVFLNTWEDHDYPHFFIIYFAIKNFKLKNFGTTLFQLATHKLYKDPTT